MAAKKNDRPIVDKDVKALVSSAIASICKVYGLTTAQAAERIKREADRIGWDIANAAVLADMKGTGLGKPANDLSTAKPGVVKTAAPAAPIKTAAPAAPVKAVSAASVRRRKRA